MSSEGVEDIGLLKISLIVSLFVVVIVLYITRAGLSALLDLINNIVFS